ncbi:MAG: RecX family transcriptional regulator, partial [Bacteroidota bacterium]
MSESEKEKINKYKAKLARYCAYRERTTHEVMQKAKDLGLYGDEAALLLDWLIAENFVNEERFAKVYVRDKFYLNKWGRNKIRQGLSQKFIDSKWIENAMGEIAPDDYDDMLSQLMDK